MNTNAKLYVGNLSWGSTDESLKSVFSAAGTVVSATVIIDKATGRSKGFGFVEMASADDAQKAIEMFNGQTVDGRPIVVNVAKPMEERPQRRYDNNRSGGYNRSY